MKWRSIDVDDQLGSRLSLDRDRPNQGPDILTDAQAHRNPVHHVHRADSSGAEIPVFIKYPIVGQVHLLVNVDQLTVVAQGGGVGDVLSHLHVTHHHGDALGRGNHPPHGGNVIPQKRCLEEKVFRGVACDSQLREGNQVRLGFPRLFQVLHDFGGIALYVPHRGVHLDQGQAKHACHDYLNGPGTEIPIEVGQVILDRRTCCLRLRR